MRVRNDDSREHTQTEQLLQPVMRDVIQTTMPWKGLVAMMNGTRKTVGDECEVRYRIQGMVVPQFVLTNGVMIYPIVVIKLLVR